MEIIKTKELSQFSKTRLTIAGVIAVLPFTPVGPLSYFGIHDFIIKRYKEGIIHIILAIIPYIPMMIYNLFFRESYNYSLAFIFSMLPYASIISYIWALVEGILILQYRNGAQSINQNGNQIEPTVHQTEQTPNQIYPTSTKALDPETQQAVDDWNTKLNKQKNREHYSVLSFIATIIPVALWTYCLIVSGGSASENGPGAIWWLMIMYYWSLGLPLFAVSIAFGIMGINTRLRWLAIVSLTIKAITIITIALLLTGAIKIS